MTEAAAGPEAAALSAAGREAVLIAQRDHAINQVLEMGAKLFAFAARIDVLQTQNDELKARLESMK